MADCNVYSRKILEVTSSGLLHFKHMNFSISFSDDLRQSRGNSVELKLKFKRILSRFRLFSRLFRLEPRCIVRLLDAEFLVCLCHQLWILNAEKRSITSVWSARTGFSTPLNLSSDGENVYWGDYGNNPGRENVNIYRMNKEHEIDICYSFSSGSIRHIHNIIYDRSLNKYWVLTGDNDKSSGIYLAAIDWSEMKPIKVGKQEYRAVVGFPYRDGLLYATDSIMNENFVYYLNLKDNSVIRLALLNGSCIYGTENRNAFFFSTTVEPVEGRGFFSMFTYRLGLGIKNNKVHLVRVDKITNKVEIIREFTKDILPMKLFQYGSIMFPKGQEISNDLWIYVMACQKFDGKSILIKNA